MDMIIWLCIGPVLFIIGARYFFRDQVTWGESGLKVGAICLIATIGYAIAVSSQTSDTEILNGHVTAKKQNRVSCEHSYRCNCYTSCSGSGSSRSCTQHCSTCYEHSYDYDWDVYTTVGNLTIDRVNRQGTKEPPRWTAVQIGEPASRPHTYTNYLKGAPNSLFNMKMAESEMNEWKSRIPQYRQVYDYYRFDHAIDVNAGIPNIKQWNAALADILRQLGPAKQVNVTAVFIKGTSREYKEVIERAWLGGKKNDVTILFGVNGTKIEWVEAFTFGKTTGNEMLAVLLRDELQKVGDVRNVPAAINVIHKTITTSFKRVEMQKYEYLKSSIRPSVGAMVAVTIIQLLSLIGLTWWAANNEWANRALSWSTYSYGARRSSELLRGIRLRR